MSKAKDFGWHLVEGVAAVADFTIENYRKMGITFAACAAGYIGVGIQQKYDGLSTLEIQLRAQGKSEAIAKCLVDATSRKYPWTSNIFTLNVADKMIKEGHALAASGKVVECNPK